MNYLAIKSNNIISIIAILLSHTANIRFTFSHIGIINVATSYRAIVLLILITIYLPKTMVQQNCDTISNEWTVICTSSSALIDITLVMRVGYRSGTNILIDSCCINKSCHGSFSIVCIRPSTTHPET